jgi:hypothetical protein
MTKREGIMQLKYARIMAGCVFAGALILGGGPVFATGGGHVPVDVCHKPGSPAEKTLTVDEKAVPGHLGHGDYLGACVPGEPDPEPTDEPTTDPTDEPEEPEQPVEPEEPAEPETPAEPEAPVEPAPVESTTEAPVTPPVDHPGMLAETGGNSFTPWLAGGALALITAGFLALRRARIKGVIE